MCRIFYEAIGGGLGSIYYVKVLITMVQVLVTESIVKMSFLKSTHEVTRKITLTDILPVCTCGILRLILETTKFNDQPKN